MVRYCSICIWLKFARNWGAVYNDINVGSCGWHGNSLTLVIAQKWFFNMYLRQMCRWPDARRTHMLWSLWTETCLYTYLQARVKYFNFDIWVLLNSVEWHIGLNETFSVRVKWFVRVDIFIYLESNTWYVFVRLPSVNR